jgi:hypothetical protein
MTQPTPTCWSRRIGRSLPSPPLARYILPSANPDGYAYSRDHNRMWRKTRSDNGGIFHCKVQGHQAFTI